jgi:hypothetical protein
MRLLFEIFGKFLTSSFLYQNKKSEPLSASVRRDNINSLSVKAERLSSTSSLR